MVQAINPGSEIRYVLRRDRALSKDEQTVFLLRVLTAREMESIEGRGFEVDPDSKSMRIKGAAMDRTALSRGLAGWENFKKPDGSEVEFKLDARDRATLASIDVIPAWAREELATVITTQNEVSEDQEGNSE